MNKSSKHRQPAVLIIDDDEQVRFVFSERLKADRLAVSCAPEGLSGLNQFRLGKPNLVLLDLRMPGLDGMDILEELQRIDASVPVIVITAHGDIPAAVQAIKAGAYDFLLKPLDLDMLSLVVHRALEFGALKREMKRIREGVETSLDQVFGVSRQAKDLARSIIRLAASDLSVILEGETGTGKTHVARAIHEHSARAKAPFVSVDMGTIPDHLAESELFGYEKGAFTGAESRKTGYFAAAHNGTLFIDEIENVSPPLQAKLLRAVEQKIIYPLGSTDPVPVDIRIIAASNKQLKTLVREKVFREDLFFRLGEFCLSIPPLRERPDDIVFFANRFLGEAEKDFIKKVRLSDRAVAKLLSHPWPGNVREIKNVVRRAVFLADECIIEPHHLEFLIELTKAENPALTTVLPLHQATRALERKLVAHALSVTGGNKSKAASLLQIDYKTMLAKAKELEN